MDKKCRFERIDCFNIFSNIFEQRKIVADEANFSTQLLVFKPNHWFLGHQSLVFEVQLLVFDKKSKDNSIC